MQSEIPASICRDGALSVDWRRGAFCCFAACSLVFGASRETRAQTFFDESAQAKSYSGIGVVQGISPNNQRVTIHHQEIQDFMPEMTMDFDVKNATELQAIRPGTEISFKLRVLSDSAWIEDIRTLRNTTQPRTIDPSLEAKAPELQMGDHWPDGELLAEDGSHVRFSNFKGRTVALTFFFTRCPLPDFCPRMNNNFEAARKLLTSVPDVRSNYLFLSVSFDPEFDRPEQLAAYARAFRAGDSGQWLFAAARRETLAHLPRRLGLMLKAGTAFSHNLRTVVLDPQGRVFRQLNGNDWTAQELADTMREANQKSGRISCK